MVISPNIVCFAILFAFICISGHSQTNDEPYKRWSIELSAALTNYEAWEIEPAVVYKPIRYAGIGVGLLFTEPIDKHSHTGYTADKELMWSIDADDLNYFLVLRPALHLSTPAIYLDKDRELALSLRVSPGLTLPFPANLHYSVDYIPNHPGVYVPIKHDRVKNTGAKTCYFHMKTAIALEMGQSALFLGYTFSNFDIYGGSRNITVEGRKLKPEVRVKYMHAVFIGLSFSY